MNQTCYDTSGICGSVDFDFDALDGEQPETYAEFCRILGEATASLFRFALAGKTPHTIVARLELLARELNPTVHSRTFEDIGAELEMTKQSIYQIFQNLRKDFEIQTRLDRSGEARERIRAGAKKAWERRRKKKDAATCEIATPNEQDTDGMQVNGGEV